MNVLTLLKQLNDQQILVGEDNGELDIQAPKGAITADVIAQLKANKTALLAFFREQKQLQGNQVSRAPITRYDDDQPIPLSFAQQRLWLIDKIGGGSSEYNLPKAIKVLGNFDLTIAEQAIDTIIERHQVLRSVFESVDGEPVAICNNEFEFAIEKIDASSLSEEQLATEVEKAAEQLFDLSQDLMVKVSYFALADTSGILLFNVHHIASDGWSTGVLVDEFVKIYQAILKGEQPNLNHLTIQYSDYAKWQKRHLQGEVLDAQLDFWREQLADLPALHSLPLDYQRPEQKQYIGGQVNDVLPPEPTKALQQLMGYSDSTLFIVLHAALAVVLSRHSNSDDIVIGSPVANRLQVELEPLIGFFVNTLVLRSAMAHDTLGELLNHIKSVNLNAQANQDVGFEQLVDVTQCERSSAYTPLTQIMLSAGTAQTTGAVLAIEGVEFAPYITQKQQDNPIAKFDLELHGELTANGLALYWTYDSALFSQAHIQQINQHLIAVLTYFGDAYQARGDLSSPLAQLDLLTQVERNYLVDELNPTISDVPQGLIHHYFEQQALSNPASIAVIFEQQHYSFNEINQRANRLARHLLSLGVKAEDKIALVTERGVHMLVGLLAILKAGGAYVPMALNWPAKRFDYVIEDCAIEYLLAEKHQLSAASFNDDLIPVIIDDDYQYTFENLASTDTDIDADRLAYVIYTSGSTGTPKGVMVTHNNVLQLVIDEPSVKVTHQDTVVYCANPVFDASTWEIWLGLLNGAKLLVVSDECLFDVAAFEQLLLDNQATILQLTAGLFSQYASGMVRAFTQLDYLLFGGDKVDIGALAWVYEHAKPKHLVHTYGPTETVAFTVTHEVTAQDIKAKHGLNTLPIGRHTRASNLYILLSGTISSGIASSGDRQLAPKGAIGEIAIGGAGVALGYLNQPQLSEKAFIYSKTLNQPLYLTGDYGRLLENGEVEFIGRMDEQVKIRGYRIELGEVERAINISEQVQQQLVMVQGQGAHKQLVAYVVLKNQVSTASCQTKLEATLSEQLPDYMVPQLVVIEQFPLTANGKIDRKALPQVSTAQAKYNLVLPQSEIEKQLAQIWAELLAKPLAEIGIHSSFFALGGYSLLIAKLNHQLQQNFGFKFDYQQFFTNPTISGLAAGLTANLAATDEGDAQKSAKKVTIKAQPRVLLVMNLPYTRTHGGANKSNRIMLEHLVALGYMVDVVTPALAVPSDITLEQLIEQLKEQVSELNVAEQSLSYQLNGVNVSAIFEPQQLRGQLQQQITEHYYDWVLVSSEDSSQLLLDAVLEVSPDNVIYIAHTPQMLPFGPQSFYPGDARKAMIERCKSVITISNYVADYVRRYSECKSVLVNHPPHFGDNFGDSFSDVDNADITKVDKDVILMVNPSTVKGIDILLPLAQNNPQHCFAVVPGWATTQSDIKRLEALDNIAFYQNQADLNLLFEQVKLLLMPSLWGEGFGMICIDAMLRGVVVLASDVGGIGEAKLGTDYLFKVNPIESYQDVGDENYIPKANVPQQDLTQWQQAIDELFADSNLYQTQSSQAKQAARAFVAGLSVKPLDEHLQQLQQTHVQAGQTQLYPLSYAQQQLAMIDELSDGYYGFILSQVHMLPADVNRQAFEQALQYMINRHDSLRTRLVKTPRGAMASIMPRLDVQQALQVQWIELNDDATADNQKSIVRHIDELFHQPFDLYNEPLIRVRCVRNPQKEGGESSSQWSLLLAMHHIISDGQSMAVFVAELTEVYQRLVFGSASDSVNDLPKLSWQYQDFAKWQRNHIAQLESSKNYWHQQLNGNIEPIELPWDFYRSGQKSYSGASYHRKISDPLAEQLLTFTQQHNASALIGLMAVVKALLYSYANDQIAVGLVSDGRQMPQLDADVNLAEQFSAQIGFYINMLVINTKVDDEDTFNRLFEKVKHNALGAYQHQAYPFSLLLQQLDYQYDAARSPLFDVMVSLDNLANNQRIFDDDKHHKAGCAHDLAFLFSRSTHTDGEKLGLQLTYNSDLFKPATIERMFGHFEQVLTNVLNQTDMPLSALSPLTQPELQQYQTWQASALVEYEQRQALHQRIEQMAEQFADKIAVLDMNRDVNNDNNDSGISYQELNQRANQLAYALVELGVSDEQVVPIIADGSIEALIAIIAVLKSGGCYLPINPSHPIERINELLTVSLEKDQASGQADDKPQTLLLADANVNEKHLPQNLNIINLANPQTLAKIANYSTDNLNLAIDGSQLAYVLYTSGTTAKPKGVMITHANVMRLLFNDKPLFEFSSDDVWTLFHSLNFDFSVWELFGALLFGGKLVIVEKLAKQEAKSLANTVIDQQVTVLSQVPPVFYNLIDEQDFTRSDNLALRYVIFGGDLLEPHKLADFYTCQIANQKTDCQLINMYGITETCIHNSFKRIEQADINSAISNIGHALPTVSMQVLNRHLQPVAINTVGELYIGGEGLARGYFKAPQLTAERFIDDPHNANRRLYRTGDLARLLDNGEFEYLGRIDNQVNIRGFRIGLAEIEYQLGQLAQVEHAVVLVKRNEAVANTDEKGSSDDYLVAYVLPADKATKDENSSKFTSDILQQLSQVLPAYMVPSAIVLVDAIPMTANSKIDKKALLALDIAAETQSADISQPQNELQRQLQSIWQQLLAIEPAQIGLDSNFFALGGHSLLLVKMSSAIAQHFGLEVPIKDIMENPTLTQLSALIEQKQLLKSVKSPDSTNTATADINSDITDHEADGDEDEQNSQEIEISI